MMQNSLVQLGILALSCGVPACSAPLDEAPVESKAEWLISGTTVPSVGDPAGYARSDGVSAIVYRNSSNRLKELSLSGAWGVGDLTAISGAPVMASQPSAYVRADNVNAVVYRSADNHIREISLAAGGWSAGDLSAIAGAPAAVGDPAAYSRTDSVSVVVYRTSSNHIEEISLPVNGLTWSRGDLNAASGGAALAVSDPVGYARADSVNAVVYRSSDNHVREISLAPGGASWSAGDLSALTGAPSAAGKPHGYRRSDHVSAVVYRGTDGHVREISLASGGSWGVGDLTAISAAPLASSDPIGYVRADGVNAVVYLSSDGHVREISLSPTTGIWSVGDISALSRAPAAIIGLANAYARADHVSSAIFKTSDGHVHEITLPVGGSTWGHADLTMVTGGVP